MTCDDVRQAVYVYLDDEFAAPEAEDATPAYRNTTWETDLSEEPEVLSGTIQHMSGVDGPRSFVTYHFFDTGLVVPRDEDFLRSEAGGSNDPKLGSVHTQRQRRDQGHTL